MGVGDLVLVLLSAVTSVTPLSAVTSVTPLSAMTSVTPLSANTAEDTASLQACPLFADGGDGRAAANHQIHPSADDDAETVIANTMQHTVNDREIRAHFITGKADHWQLSSLLHVMTLHRGGSDAVVMETNRINQIVEGKQNNLSPASELQESKLEARHIQSPLKQRLEYKHKNPTLRPGGGVLRSVSLPRRILNSEMIINATVDEASLREMVMLVVKEEMKECDLTLAYDDGFRHHQLLQHLLLLPNPRQEVHIHKAEDLLRVAWASPRCRGYLILLQDLNPLLQEINSSYDSWDYHGRYLVVGSSLEELVALTKSSKGRKTQHIVGFVKSVSVGEWRVYMNQLYWGQGMHVFTTWRGRSFTSQADFFPDKLSDLRGAVLKVVAFVWEPSIFYYLASNGSVLFRYGVDIEITRLLAQALNFSLEFVEPPPGELWGSEKMDGTWTGMMGMLDTRMADMGVANLYVSMTRAAIIDYSDPYDSEVTCFLARREPPVPRWQALAYPFQWGVWLAIFICLLISGPAIFLLVSISRKFGREIGSLRTLSGSWTYSVGMHLMKSQAHLPLTTTTQVFTTLLWLYTTILAIAYCTNLTAFLLVNKPPKAIETIEDLYDSDLKVAGMGEFYKNELASASDPYLKGLAKIYEGQTSTNEAYQKVLKGEVVFLQNRAFVEFIARTKFTSGGVSRMRIMKECFAPYNIAMGLQRHSPLKTKFDKVIGWVQQSGLLRRYFLNSLRLAASTQEYKGGDERGVDEQSDSKGDGGVVPLSLDHLQGAFLILVVGCLLAGCLFLHEIAC